MLVNNMGYGTLEDLENVAKAQVEDKSIPAITDLDTPLVMNSRLKKLIKAVREQQRSHGTGGGREQWRMKMFPYHQRS